MPDPTDLTDLPIPSINFTLTANALRGFEEYRALFAESFPDNPPEFPSIGWGIYTMDNGIVFENVMVTFYQQAQADEVRPYLRRVQGVDLIYLISPDYHHKLEGAIIDYRTGEGFFLRDPATGAENRLPQDVIDDIRALRAGSASAED
ncbi:hypothetical protein [Xanthobacter sp. KR7-225]|uniref:hypothetical protein n=1 Tax=Xanthobacter sp. KR7-225 TaxID=3156613 RepID=UPI0032B3F162